MPKIANDNRPTLVFSVRQSALLQISQTPMLPNSGINAAKCQTKQNDSHCISNVSKLKSPESIISNQEITSKGFAKTTDNILTCKTIHKAVIPPEILENRKQFDKLKNAYTSYQKIFAIYSHLKLSFNKPLLYRQRNLSYMKHRRKAFYGSASSENEESRGVNYPVKMIDHQIANTTKMDSWSTFEARNSGLSEKNFLQVCFVGLQKETYLNSFTCFLCDIECITFKSLFAHLKCSHGRLEFKCTASPNYRITIRPNPSFDLTPFLNAQIAKSSGVPRFPHYTCLVSNELRNYQANFNQFYQSDYSLAKVAALAKPAMYRSQVYYHSTSCNQILPDSAEVDSEDELNLKAYWTTAREYDNVDEIIDVSESEGALTKLWNMHMLKNRGNYFGHCHMYGQAVLFIQENAEQILKQNLKNNCKLSFFALHGHGILKAVECEELSVYLNKEERRLKALGII